MTGDWRVTGAGMVTALGTDVVASCAAARAGIRRSRELPQLVLRGEEDGEDACPIGHPLEGLTTGFEGRARLLRLLVLALEDLRSRAWGGGEPPSGTRLYLSVPEPSRIYTELDRIVRTAWRTAREQEAAALEAETSFERAEWLWARAAPLAGCSGVRLAFASSGRTGFTSALLSAATDLASGAAEAAIVGGVDSLLDVETLLWLHETRRLKYADMPVGVEPGEAAALVLLGRHERAGSEGGASIGGMLLRPSQARGAMGVGDIVERAREASGMSAAPAWIVADHDGTSERAMLWGQTLMALGRHAEGRGVALTYPAASFGDVGAAFGAVSTCVAMAALQRGYAPARSGLVVTSDEPRVQAVHWVHADGAR